MFADAADKGSEAVEQVKNAIKFELKKRGAPYQIEGGYQLQTVTDGGPQYPKNEMLPYIRPNLVVTTHTGAEIKLINTGSNQTEDTLTVRGKELRRSYRPPYYLQYLGDRP